MLSEVVVDASESVCASSLLGLTPQSVARCSSVVGHQRPSARLPPRLKHGIRPTVQAQSIARCAPSVPRSSDWRLMFATNYLNLFKWPA